jgi:uncharacterized MAPEG superfamily protein
MNPSLHVLVLYVAWTLALLLLMEVMRSHLVLARRVPANAFRPDNANLSPFLQRLARAHANCLEGFPVFGALLLIAHLAGRNDVTDPLAYPFLVARVLQSTIHLASTSPAAVTLRFLFFAAQLGIAVYWTIRLLDG